MNTEQYGNLHYLCDKVDELGLEVIKLKEELASIKASIKALGVVSEKNPKNILSISPTNRKYWTGRVIFDTPKIDEQTIGFHCGPETKDGWFDDSFDGGLTPQLEELLGQFDVSIGDAENYHTIQVPDGVDPNKVWNDVKKILENAGAVQWQRP